MYKIAFMGDKASVLGFRALGLDVITPDSEAEARRQLKRLISEEYAIIYVTEELYALLEPEISALQTQPTPAVVPVPGSSGGTGLGMRLLAENVRKTVGHAALDTERTDAYG